MIVKRKPDIMEDLRDALAVVQWCDKEHAWDDSGEWNDACRDIPGNYVPWCRPLLLAITL
jgi:hypothetical protein